MHSATAPDISGPRGLLRTWFGPAPFLGWILGFLVCAVLEQAFGRSLADLLTLPKMPVLFGIAVLFKAVAGIVNALFKGYAFDPATLLDVPMAAVYVLAIYVVPLALVCRFTARPLNAVASRLMSLPLLVTALVHLGLIYLTCHVWTSLSDYRLITLKLMLIFILLTLSLNLINGYMGEFSCSHPGFMAIGAYMTSLFTVGLFFNNEILGQAVFQTNLAYLSFPLALFLGGMAAAMAALIIAVPSFKTRGDYLAIITLAFLFIVKSFFENMPALGGPRGLAGQPDWATLPVVFLVVVVGVWMINNFVTSTLGKALCAVRDDETAAEAMTVDTRRVKMSAFLFGAFWAGVAGGLFAHVLRYVNPAMFGVTQLAEVMAMTYFGGLNSVYGSIVGAVSISLLGEALRPLEILKWIVIPLLLILVMIYRPTGLVAFKEFDLRRVLGPRLDKE